DVAGFIERRGEAFPGYVGFAVDVELLTTVLDSQGCVLRAGDVLLVRTGFVRDCVRGEHADQAREHRTWPGLIARESMAEFLWDSGVVAVVADNPSVEVSPGSPDDGYLHRRLLAMLGMPMGELFD